MLAMMYGAEPAHAKRLPIVVVMPFGWRHAAGLTRLTHQLAGLNGAHDHLPSSMSPIALSPDGRLATMYGLELFRRHGRIMPAPERENSATCRGRFPHSPH